MLKCNINKESKENMVIANGTILEIMNDLCNIISHIISTIGNTEEEKLKMLTMLYTSVGEYIMEGENNGKNN